VLPKLLGIVLTKASKRKVTHMSHFTSSVKNKQQKHPKVHYQQYLYNAGEPHDYVSHDTPAALEVELLENDYSLRRQFKRTAQNMRNLYS